MTQPEGDVQALAGAHGPQAPPGPHVAPGPHGAWTTAPSAGYGTYAPYRDPGGPAAQRPPYAGHPPYAGPPPLEMSDLIATYWPGPRPNAAPPIMLGGAALAGVVGATVLATESLGLNIVLTTLAALAGLAPVIRYRLNPTSLAFGALTLALVAMAAVRDADWVVALGLVLAVATGSYALVGGRGWVELLLAGCSLPAAGLRMLPWASRGVAATLRPAARGRGKVRLGLSLATTAVVILVFGGLLASADAEFSRLAESLVPDLDAGTIFGRGFLFLAVGGVTLAAGYLTLGRPLWRRLTPGPGRPVRMLEWALPIGALDALFLSFATVQATVLLAPDRDALLRSTGLTYAEYARQGFFQLVATTVLVLAVIAIAVRKAPRHTARERAVVRIMLGMLCALTLVIVAVALSRLGMYEQAFGFTRLRLWVHAFELWLGLVVVLIAVAGAGVWRRGRWLPRAVAASGAAMLIGLGAINPDGLIAEHNIDRFNRTGKIDINYLYGLSADAVPALDRLREPYRSCALAWLTVKLQERDPWYARNLGRERARAILQDRPTAAPPGGCPPSTRIDGD
jgi:hypothetical protein